MDPKLEPYHRPDRTLLLSGISRSGTSLMSALINEIPNAVCFNEVLPTDPSGLPEILARIRRDLVKGRPVPNKFDGSGNLTTDTLDKAVVREKRKVEKPLDRNVLVGSKRNIPYLNAMEELLRHGFKTIVMIRDPVYTIGSWSRPAAAEARIPGACIGPDDLHPHFHPVTFTRNDPVERRAEAWQHYAELIWSQRNRIEILTYERLCLDTRSVLLDLCSRLDLAPPDRIGLAVDRPRNLDDRYADLPRIRRAVRTFCTTRKHFGYE